MLFLAPIVVRVSMHVAHLKLAMIHAMETMHVMTQKVKVPATVILHVMLTALRSVTIRAMAIGHALEDGRFF